MANLILFFWNVCFPVSQLLSRKTKIHIFIKHYSETITYTRRTILDYDKKMMKEDRVFSKGKLSQNTYNPIYEEEEWRERHTTELEDLYNEPNVVNVIKRGQAMSHE
jgi:hypothetical protein